MPTDAQRRAPYIAGDGSIQSDVPCWKCDYSLRTSTLERDCPECGEPVASTFVNLLALQPTAWVNRLALAALGCVLAVALAAVSMLTGMIISASMMPPLGQTQAPDPAKEWAVRIASWVPHIAFFCALFVLSITNADSPADPSRRQQLRLRLLTALAAIFFLVDLFVPERLLVVSAALSFVSMLFEAAAVLTALHLLRELLQRARRPRAARVTTFLLWSGIPLALLALVAVLTPILSALDMPPPPYAMTTLLPAPGGAQHYLVVQPDGSVSHTTSLPPGVPLYQAKNVAPMFTSALSCACMPIGLSWLAVTTAIFVASTAAFWNARRLGEQLLGIRRRL